MKKALIAGRLTLVLALLVAARGASSQQVDSSTAGIGARPAERRGPSNARLLLVSELASITIASNGAQLAVNTDVERCRRRHQEIEGLFFDSCPFYTLATTRAVWIGGSAAGATLGAVLVAQRRGCPVGKALWRSLAGAAVGSVPGLLVVSSQPRVYDPPRSILLGVTPLLSGAGATLAVAGCRGAPMRRP